MAEIEPVFAEDLCAIARVRMAIEKLPFGDRLRVVRFVLDDLMRTEVYVSENKVSP